MEQYISKSALVAEIERIIDILINNSGCIGAFGENQITIYEDILSLINTAEVKEVNLEKELESWRHNHFHGRRDKETSGEYLERVSQLDLAKHFFELGLKAQKGEEV